MIIRVVSLFLRLVRNGLLLLNDISMRKKLFAAFFIFTAIPFGSYITVSYVKSTKALESQMIYSSEKAFEQALTLIEYNVAIISRTTELILMDETIQEVMNRSIQGVYPNIDQVRDFLKLKDKIIYLERSQDVDKIRIYIKNGLIFSDENINFYDLDSVKGSSWYKILHDSNQAFLWCPPKYMDEAGKDNRKFISNTRILKNPTNYREDIGILRVDMDEYKIGKTLAGTKVVPSSHVAIVNSRGDVISSTDGFEHFYDSLEKANLFTLIEERDSLQPWKASLNKKNYMLQSVGIKGTDWTLLCLTLYDDIINITNKLRNEMIFVLIGAVVLSYVISYLISHTITKRISILMRQMNRVKEGDLNIRVLQQGEDEVGQLSSTFSYMVSRMGQMMEEQARLGKEIRSAEFKALQAQINPHFLYNTLELINWQAMKYNAPTVSAIVQTMAKFYKLSLSRGEEIISIKEEMELTRAYFQIQNMRFKNSIYLVEESLESLYEYRIPKITIQPLVENAILHGIRTKKEAIGTVTIKGSFEKEAILIEVIDDGVGISPKRLIEVKSGNYESKSTGNGYGLKNISYRLQLHYGDGYGIQMESSVDTGTHCKVMIPLTKL